MTDALVNQQQPLTQPVQPGGGHPHANCSPAFSCSWQAGVDTSKQTPPVPPTTAPRAHFTCALDPGRFAQTHFTQVSPRKKKGHLHKEGAAGALSQLCANHMAHPPTAAISSRRLSWHTHTHLSSTHTDAEAWSGLAGSTTLHTCTCKLHDAMECLQASPKRAMRPSHTCTHTKLPGSCRSRRTERQASQAVTTSRVLHPCCGPRKLPGNCTQRKMTPAS